MFSEEDYITADLPERGDHPGGEVELALSRIAGGQVIADPPGVERRRDQESDEDAEEEEEPGHRRMKKKRLRWSITSVDGWAVGQPGPGPEWTPAKGVSLTLEELGACHRCQTPLAVAEYICNSASRDSRRGNSAGRRACSGAPPVQKPRIRTSEVGVQTEVPTSETAVQAPTPGEAIAQAQVAIAGSALASLAAPASTVAGEGSDGDQILLTADRAFAKRRVREALDAMARLAAGPSSLAVPGGGRSGLLHAAESAVRSLEGGAEAAVSTDEVDDTRILGHCRQAGVPTLSSPEGGEGGVQEMEFQEGAVAALKSGALTALAASKEERAGGVELPPRFSEDTRNEHDRVEGFLLGAGTAGEKAAAAGGAPVLDALANVAAMLCAPGGGGSAGLGQVLEAITAVAALLPPAGLRRGVAVGGRRWEAPASRLARPEGRPLRAARALRRPGRRRAEGRRRSREGAGTPGPPGGRGGRG